MWGMPKCAAISSPCVPLPAPGGATISTRIPPPLHIISPAARQVDTPDRPPAPKPQERRAATPRVPRCRRRPIMIHGKADAGCHLRHRRIRASELALPYITVAVFRSVTALQLIVARGQGATVT